MKALQAEQKIVLTFLYNLAKEVHANPQKIADLPQIFKNYIDSRGRLPFITVDSEPYYNALASSKLPTLETTAPILSYTLADLLKSYPPLQGGMSGDHINYEAVTYNNDMAALIGRFVDCWNMTEQ